MLLRRAEKNKMKEFPEEFLLFLLVAAPRGVESGVVLRVNGEGPVNVWGLKI